MKVGDTFTYTQIINYPFKRVYIYDIEILKINKKTLIYSMKEKNSAKAEYKATIDYFLNKYGDFLKGDK